MNPSRPLLHVTAPNGWLNDPHGICWVAGEYHLFYQYNPAGNEWVAAIQWGHATSPDLMQWHHQPAALIPAEGEGCWTGATVIENGRPTIFYTRVDVNDPAIGGIAIATPDAQMVNWTSSSDVVVVGPPDELQANVFRDPCIFASDAGWTMIVGVGVDGGVGLAVQYSSDDRRNWTYDGVLCSRPSDSTDGCWTGSMWECPQLFRVGQDWVLAVSVWDEDRLFYVAAAVGTYDGHTFVPERWSRLTHDEISYAMTSFTDKDGRPCVMFWLRENADHPPDARPWAGALSLPMVITVIPDRSLRLLPHPDVDGLQQSETIFDAPLTGVLEVDVAVPLSMCLPLGATDSWEIAFNDAANVLLTCSAESSTLRVQTGQDPTSTIPTAGESVRVVIDDGIVEIYGGNGVAVRRIPAGLGMGLSIKGSTEHSVRVESLARVDGHALETSRGS